MRVVRGKLISLRRRAHDKGPLAASEIPATFRYPAAEYQVDWLTPALLAPPSLDDGVRSELC